MSFEEEIRSAIVRAQQATSSPPGSEYLAILTETARGLETFGVSARIIQSPRDPRSSMLFLHPLYRPQQGAPILRFVIDGGKVAVSGEHAMQLATPQELKDWLLRFVQLPAFLDSLGVLREKAAEPVEARLMAAREHGFTRGDILVAVQPSDQVAIATASPSVVLSLAVEPIQFPGNASYDTNIHYSNLNSAGIILQLVEVAPIGARLRLSGNRFGETLSYPGPF